MGLDLVCFELKTTNCPHAWLRVLDSSECSGDDWRYESLMALHSLVASSLIHMDFVDGIRKGNSRLPGFLVRGLNHTPPMPHYMQDTSERDYVACRQRGEHLNGRKVDPRWGLLISLIRISTQ